MIAVTALNPLLEYIQHKSEVIEVYRASNKLHLLLMSGREYKIAKGQMVQSSDERFRPLLNLIKTGYIKRYEIGNDGTIAVQAVYGPKDIFPLTLVYRTLLEQEVYQGPEIVYYEAMTDAVIYSIDTHKLKDAVQSDSEFYRDILLETGVRSHINILNVENHSLKSSFKRTAHLLAFYARDFGERSSLGIKIRIDLTHQDIADILNLTRETVSTNMHKLQKKKLISNGRTSVTVKNLERLEKVAYS